MKKIILLALIAIAPFGAFAQKFGHINSADIIPLMPEYKNAQTEIQTLQKQYEEELKYMETEYTKKIEDYEKQRETLPENIRTRREQEIMDSRQKAIEKQLKLRQPMYLETAAYGHMGRKNEIVKKTFTSNYHETRIIDVELFTWEKLDLIEKLKEGFGI